MPPSSWSSALLWNVGVLRPDQGPHLTSLLLPKSALTTVNPALERSTTGPLHLPCSGPALSPKIQTQVPQISPGDTLRPSNPHDHTSSPKPPARQPGPILTLSTTPTYNSKAKPKSKSLAHPTILSTYYVPSTVPGAGDLAANKTDTNLCPVGTEALVGRKQQGKSLGYTVSFRMTSTIQKTKAGTGGGKYCMGSGYHF